MKRNLFLIALLCFACGVRLYGRENETQRAARQNYIFALSSEHEGVRNSAIFRVLQYKAAYPQDDCSAFIKRLQQISLDDSSVKNRMYAFLACALLQDAKLFAAALPPQSENDKDAYFAGLHNVLQKESSVAVGNE